MRSRFHIGKNDVPSELYRATGKRYNPTAHRVNVRNSTIRADLIDAMSKLEEAGLPEKVSMDSMAPILGALDKHGKEVVSGTFRHVWGNKTIVIAIGEDGKVSAEIVENKG